MISNGYLNNLTNVNECSNRISYYFSGIQSNLLEIKNYRLTAERKKYLIVSSKALYYRMYSVVEYAKERFPNTPWFMPMKYEDFFGYENK